MDVCKAKHPFQRLVVSKAEALEMFQHNPFKVSLITNKVPEGSKTTVYRCGPLIDLCMGPHLPNTGKCSISFDRLFFHPVIVDSIFVRPGKIKAFAAIKSSSTNWLGQVTNDPLQRVYGIAFPDKAMLKQWNEFQEKAKQRDHRLLGNNSYRNLLKSFLNNTLIILLFLFYRHKARIVFLSPIITRKLLLVTSWCTCLQ